MKKLFILICACFLLGGCTWFEKDNFQDIYTYTTIYPIQYATKELYNDYTNVESIYPNDIDVITYSLTDKQKKKYSKGETFIYSGIANEGMIAKDFINLNNKLQIIDAMKNMSYKNSIEELWLDPSNYLMICRNVKSGLTDYIDSIYTVAEIEKKYNNLKEEVSELDVELYNLGKNGKYKTLLVSNNMFKYLEKYNITVISLQPSSTGLDKSYSTAKKLISSKSIKYIFVKKGEQLDSKLTRFIEDNSLTKIEVDTLSNLTTEQSKNKEDYISIMKEIISNYKKELYK